MALQVQSLSGTTVASFEAAELSEVELQAPVKEKLAPVLGVPRFRLRLLCAGRTVGSETWKELGHPGELQVVVLEYCQDKAESLWNASAGGDVAAVAQLLQLPQDPNAVTSIFCDDEEEEEEDGPSAAPLWVAAGCGHTEVVRLLLEAGADKDAEHSALGSTPLHEAAENGTPEVVRLLLEARADVSRRNCFNRTPLLGASRCCNAESVRLLVGARADIGAQDSYGRTALVACLGDRDKPGASPTEVVQCLLQARASVEGSPEACPQLPLALAAASGSLPILETLMEARADVNRTDDEGQSPLWCAAAGGHLPVVQRLVRAGANPDACDVHGVSAMVMAASRGEAHVVDYLIEKRANLHSADLQGRNAYWYAQESEEEAMAQHLLELGILQTPRCEAERGDAAVPAAKAPSCTERLLEFPMEGP